MPEGFLSTHLVGGVRPGTVVRLAAPKGNFVLPNPPPASILFITAGSGITPVMSILRTLVRREHLSDVLHLHSAPTPTDMLFATELAELTQTHPGYRLITRATRVQGRLDPNRIADEVPDWRDRQTWICGPGAMLDTAEKLWAANGIADHLHSERFAAVRTTHRSSGGSVSFARSGKTLAADGATSLMEVGEQAGVLMPFGCRMGICHTCVVGLAEGRVRDLRTGAEHEAGSRIQTCISAASGDCVLDA
jgi:ferredoxin-NADP reductase